MIWALYAIMAFGLFAFLLPAFHGQRGDVTEDAEADAYFEHIQAIRDDVTLRGDEEAAAILALERQLLAGQTRPDMVTPHANRLTAALALGACLLSGAGLYFISGRPDLTVPGALPSATLAPQQAIAQAAPPEHDRGTQLATLVATLEGRLQNERADDPNSWLLYARSLMNLGRFDEAVAAYIRTAELTDGTPEVLEELDRAKEFIAQGGRAAPRDDSPKPLRGPTSDDIAAAQSLNENDRAEMVGAMVNSLAARLEVAPDDPAGWTRLIRSRLVLGQPVQARADVGRMQTAFSEQPDQIERILADSGWNERGP